MVAASIPEHYILLLTVCSVSPKFSLITELIFKTSKPLKQFRKTLKEIRKLLRELKRKKK